MINGVAAQFLLDDKGFIDGHWVSAQSGATLEVCNPATGAVIGTMPDMDGEDTATAITAADTAFATWRHTLAAERAELLLRWYALMHDYADDLARILTTEQGKPLAEARGEVAYAASFLRWFGEEARRADGMLIPTHKKGARVVVMHQPIGVAAIITPWNFPLAMITRKLGAALAAGCTAVIKPAELTPYSAIALLKLAEKAGLPAGVCNLVLGQAQPIGAALTASPAVRTLSFTGSTRVGKLLAEQSAGTMKKLSLELGGNAAFIVFDDADIDAAVEGAMACKFRNSGQTCVSANRFYVHRAVYDDFAQKLATRVAALKTGNGLDAGVTIGPLTHTDGVTKVERHVQDALQRGARLLAGGKRHELGGQFFEPTVLVDVPFDAQLTCEETFGPLAAILPFEHEKQVIAAANATPYGLAGYFYSRNHARIWRVAEALECGIVGVNEGLISSEIAPFGGVKESGLGREGSHWGIEEYQEVKYMLLGGLDL